MLCRRLDPGRARPTFRLDLNSVLLNLLEGRAVLFRGKHLIHHCIDLGLDLVWFLVRRGFS